MWPLWPSTYAADLKQTDALPALIEVFVNINSYTVIINFTLTLFLFFFYIYQNVR